MMQVKAQRQLHMPNSLLVEIVQVRITKIKLFEVVTMAKKTTQLFLKPKQLQQPSWGQLEYLKQQSCDKIHY